MEFEKSFWRSAGICLILAGALFLALGAMSGFLNVEDVRRSPIFMWRMIVAVIIALLLLFGSVGIYLQHPRRHRLPVTAAFALAFVGSALLLAHEWQELFLARELATRFPDTFAKLDDAPGLTSFDWEAIIAVGTFTTGWIALSVATMFAPAFSKWAGALVIAGIFAVPVMTAALGMPFGPFIGSAVITTGLVWLGLNLRSAGLTHD